MELRLKDIRSFGESPPAKLAPITVLIGENSSGKSTFLAAFRVLVEVIQGDFRPSFNHEPFLMGSYDQIAHTHRGPRDRAKSFQIGLNFEVPTNVNSDGVQPGLFDTRTKSARSNPGYLDLTFREIAGHPQIDKLEFDFGGQKLLVELTDTQSINAIRLTSDSSELNLTRDELKDDIAPIFGEPLYFDLGTLLRLLGHSLMRKRPSPPSSPRGSGWREEIEDLRGASMWLRRQFRGTAYAAAPVRTRPERTYDPIKETENPEGGHIPMALARLFATRDLRETEEVIAGLNAYGKASGMFSKLVVKRLGKSGSDPFQIKVSTGNISPNLIDVGYGVSQVLPILVDVLQGEERQYFLLQQPEVHLHPKSQAELASFFVEMATKHSRRFIIETHSDFIIDRIRIEVKKGIVNPRDVSLIFFERSKGATKIHNMSLDAQGNLVGAPNGYRKFFLNEEKQLLGL